MRVSGSGSGSRSWILRFCTACEPRKGKRYWKTNGWTWYSRAVRGKGTYMCPPVKWQKRREPFSKKRIITNDPAGEH